MTSEELKERYSMRDIVARYGFVPNRTGFISCPFHKSDKNPSMKINDKSFYCFGCCCSGDIFTFVQKMDNLTFREAFIELGGVYEQQHKFSSQLKIYRAKKARETELNRQNKLKDRKRLNNMLIGIYRRYMEKSEPLSEVWCDCYNALQYQMYLSEILNGKEQ